MRILNLGAKSPFYNILRDGEEGHRRRSSGLNSLHLQTLVIRYAGP